MLLFLPATSAIRPTSYLIPEPYDYRPSQGYYHHHDAPRFVVPSYPAPELDFFHQHSAEELEEREYRRALEVVANHRRYQAEKEVAIRRQQLAEAGRERYFAALTGELERRQQEELLSARRVESIRSQQARARLIVAGRQHALNAFLQQLKGAQPARHVRTLVVCSTLITSSPQITRQPHVVKREPVADALKQRLSTESDSNITEPIQNILSSLEPRSVQSEGPKDPGEDGAKLIENLLSSIYPGLVFLAQSQPTPLTERVQPSVSDKWKGKARAVDVKGPLKPAPKPESAGEPFADILRHAMELSKSTTARQSPDEAGPSGSSPSSPPSTRPAVIEREQAQIDRAIALSSVEHIQDTLTKLQTDFTLPTELDHYTRSTDGRDETASVSSFSSNLAKLISYTSAKKSVYKYENELNGLLEELDRIDSHGDAEVREKRKEVVKAVEKALEGVEHVVSEVVEKRVSLVSAATSATEEPLKVFDADEGITKVAPAQEQVDTPVVVDTVTVPEASTPVQAEETVAETAEGALPEPNAPTEPTPTGSDVAASTATITPASVELMSVTEHEPTMYQVEADATETADTFLSPERVSTPSPAKKPQEIDNDTDEEIIVLDSDAEKGNWSELEQ